LEIKWKKIIAQMAAIRTSSKKKEKNTKERKTFRLPPPSNKLFCFSANTSSPSSFQVEGNIFFLLPLHFFLLPPPVPFSIIHLL
jgi:hypothetical protein